MSPQKSKTVYAASGWQYTVADGDVHARWDGIDE